jgi:DNA-binding NarL/FixJ family response regulator
LLLSSLTDSELATRSNAANINGYVSKRSGIHALIHRVNEILAPNVGEAPRG